MDKLKELWEELTTTEKIMVSIRNVACCCILLVPLLDMLGMLSSVTETAWLLPVIAISQTVLSWKQSRTTALFFLGFLVFFFFVFFISRC